MTARRSLSGWHTHSYYCMCHRRQASKQLSSKIDDDGEERCAFKEKWTSNYFLFEITFACFALTVMDKENFFCDTKRDTETK